MKITIYKALIGATLIHRPIFVCKQLVECRTKAIKSKQMRLSLQVLTFLLCAPVCIR
ncbi:hypothetical protein NXY19_21460 [Bacteroides fragilis]|nr:hypothetical protein [Bacteroides fragilis]